MLLDRPTGHTWVRPCYTESSHRYLEAFLSSSSHRPRRTHLFCFVLQTNCCFLQVWIHIARIRFPRRASFASRMGVSTVLPLAASHRKTAAFIAVWILLLVVILTHLAGSGSRIQAYLTRTATYTPPIILILQQVHSGSAPASKRAYGTARDEVDRQAERQALYEASVSSHRKYAEAWGYEYRVDRREWVSGGGGLHFLNKIYALLDAVVQALGDEQGPEWIM